MENVDVNVIELLEYLQDMVENASKVPVTGKVIVDKREVLEVVEQIVNYLPDQFKKAQWVMNERERILGEAQKEYETIKAETMEMLKKNIENHDVVKEAKIRAQEIVQAAQRDSKQMRLGARDYADEILSQLEREVEVKKVELLDQIKDTVENFGVSLNDTLSSTSTTIKHNIKELRNMK